MEGYVPENPLWMCKLENLWNELFSPVLPIEITARHCEMEHLNCVEVCWGMAFGEIPPSDVVLAVSKSLELRRHKPHLWEGFIPSYEDVFWKPVQDLRIGYVILCHPLRQFIDSVNQLSSVAFIGAEHKVRCNFSLAAIWTSLIWEYLTRVTSNLTPHTTETWMLLGPPYLVHILLGLKGKVQMFPVHCIESFVWPLVLFTSGQIFSCYLFTSMELQRWRYVASEFAVPYKQGHIFLGEERNLLFVIAVVERYCNWFPCQRVAYAVKLLHQGELFPLEKSIHMDVYMDISKGTMEELLGCPETAAYVCAFGARLYAAAVVWRHLKSM